MKTNPTPTAIDLVALARRHRLLGGSHLSLIDAASAAPEVIACVAPIAENEPMAWNPPRRHESPYGAGEIPGIYELTVDGVSVQVWGVPRPSTYADAMGDAGHANERAEAEARAGLLLVEMAGINPKRRGARKAA